MPGIFGTEVLMQVREKFNQIELPVIMVTAKPMLRISLEACKAARMILLQSP